MEEEAAVEPKQLPRKLKALTALQKLETPAWLADPPLCIGELMKLSEWK
jgi:hypothetical protein